MSDGGVYAGICYRDFGELLVRDLRLITVVVALWWIGTFSWQLVQRRRTSDVWFSNSHSSGKEMLDMTRCTCGMGKSWEWDECNKSRDDRLAPMSLHIFSECPVFLERVWQKNFMIGYVKYQGLCLGWWRCWDVGFVRIWLGKVNVRMVVLSVWHNTTTQKHRKLPRT